MGPTLAIASVRTFSSAIYIEELTICCIITIIMQFNQFYFIIKNQLELFFIKKFIQINKI